jgi:hypothetical protein
LYELDNTKQAENKRTHGSTKKWQSPGQENKVLDLNAAEKPPQAQKLNFDAVASSQADQSALS